MDDTNATYNKMKDELQELKAKMQWFSDSSFLLHKEIDVEKAYGYLRVNPTSAPFLYEKYESLRPVLREVVNPKNPLYLKEVADQLSDVIEITDLQADISELEEKRRTMINQRNELDRLVEEKSSEYEELSNEFERLTQERDDIQRQLANLTTDEAMEKIKSFYDAVSNFIESALESQKKLSVSEAYHNLRLDMNQINTLKLLSEKAETDMDFITKEDLISPDKLDEVRKKIREDMQREQEEGMKAMESFTVYNPKKEISKSIDAVQLVKKQLTRGDYTEGGMFFTDHGIGILQSNLDISVNLLSNLLQQIENTERRKK